MYRYRRLCAVALVCLCVGATASADLRIDPQSSFGQMIHSTQDMKVFKTPQCGCCDDWIRHVEAAGIGVEAVDVSHAALDRIKQQGGLQAGLGSCHTAFIDGYLIEGHVPVQDIQRLLTEAPMVRGLSVPGMPIGSPGMEMGERFDPYHVLSFDLEGNTQLFSSYHQP
ncbi:DUF411 domain-containing protein [Thiorhodospira sibirica]|uniref:DUF411 domain-containing protein n=1 Tax=Thiorhodospira sibirica TaxID=154347 RepID=UPI00022C3FFC|nr:DUF411 domain-containing protein [Thiorhodospira sibirica]